MNSWETEIMRTPVHETKVPTSANVSGSKIIYKVKTEKSGLRRLKARLCPHGNPKKMNHIIRNALLNSQIRHHPFYVEPR